MFICLFVCISFLLTLEEQSVGSVVLFGLVGFKIRYLGGGSTSFFCFDRINKISHFTSFCTAVLYTNRLISHIKGSLRQCVCFGGSNMACYGNRVTNGVSLNVCNFFPVLF